MIDYNLTSLSTMAKVVDQASASYTRRIDRLTALSRPISVVTRSPARRTEPLIYLNRYAQYTLRSQVKPICVKYQWTVPVCVECDFENAGLHGFNANFGQKILLRLRHPQQYGGGFIDYNSVLHCMLHELCHNRYLGHSADFYRLLDTLVEDCRQLIREGITGQYSERQDSAVSKS